LPAAGPGGDGLAGEAGEGGRGGGLGDDGGSDQRGYCVYCPAPRYPLMARARGWQGTVRVGLSVSADGSVTEASLRESSGYRVLDRAAVDVARHSRFAPPASRGLPTPLRGRIDYRFELSTAKEGGM
jgi:TonB family protein